MKNEVELSTQVALFLTQQAELYGEEPFWLGVPPAKAEPPAFVAPVVQMIDKSAVDKKKDSTQKEQLDQFYADFKECTKCALSKGRTQIVLGSGNPFAKVMFIGEGPGRDEDLKGLPFVGAAGQILERMLKRMGFIRKEVYITNIVKCRPPSNRNPQENEIAACEPLLERQIHIIKPRFIFCLGRVAANALLQNSDTLGRLRQKEHSCHGARTFITYHPAALLREQSLFWEVFEDMQLFRQAYDADIGDKPPMAEMTRKN